MLFPALGMTTAVYLMMTPLLGLESGLRAVLCVGVGVACAVLAPLSVRYSKAGAWMTALGIVLGTANLVVDAPIGAFASLSIAALGLLFGGTALVPVLVATRAVIPAAAPAWPATVPQGAPEARPEAPRDLPIAA